MTARTTKILLQAVIITAFSAIPASACVTWRSQTLTDVRGANVAVIGRIVSYEFQPTDGRSVRSAIFTVEPVLPLRGVGFSQQTIYWENSTFGVPTEWGDEQTVFMAAKRISPDFRKLRGGIFDRSGEAVLFELLQTPCAPAFIFKAQSVRSVLASSLVLWNWIVAICAAGMFLRFLRIRRKRRQEI